MIRTRASHGQEYGGSFLLYDDSSSFSLSLSLSVCVLPITLAAPSFLRDASSSINSIYLLMSSSVFIFLRPDRFESLLGWDHYSPNDEVVIISPSGH